MNNEEKYHKFLNHHGSHQDEFTDFLEKSTSAQIPQGRGKEQIWESIESEISDSKSKSMSMWRYVGIAASIALVAVMGYLLYDPSQQLSFQTAEAQTMSHELPDASVVILNANSKLSYEEDWKRTLTLSGEAFFEVTKGEKFTVQTESGSVEVLGTSFNVFARSGKLKVACKTGKVKVSIPLENYETVIAPGEMITFKNDTIKKVTVATNLMGSWQTGVFYFNDQPIEEVVEELKRQFGIQIELNLHKPVEFNGYFTNKSLAQALDQICLPLGLEYSKASTSSIVISDTE
ncbi:MAG: FecR domain-containing protein [Ekhidna sp.]